MVTDAHIALRRDGELVRITEPRLNAFPSRQLSVGTPSVWSTPVQDVYVALGGLEPDRVTLNLFRYPFMVWLWVGGGMIAAGGFWALGGRRRRPDPGATTTITSTDAALEVDRVR